jgi:hypothetical protein
MADSFNVGSYFYADGTQNAPMRGDRYGGLAVSELRAPYAEMTGRGLRYDGANQAAVTTTAAFATTWTGAGLYNPIGSPVNCEIDLVGFSILVAFPAAAAVGIMVGYSTTTAISGQAADGVYNAIAGAYPAGNGLFLKGGTLPVAPTLRKVLASGITGAITTGVTVPALFDLKGAIVVPPGGYACFYTTTVSGTNGFIGSMSWLEVPR